MSELLLFIFQVAAGAAAAGCWESHGRALIERMAALGVNTLDVNSWTAVLLGMSRLGCPDECSEVWCSPLFLPLFPVYCILYNFVIAIIIISIVAIITLFFIIRIVAKIHIFLFVYFDLVMYFTQKQWQTSAHLHQPRGTKQIRISAEAS